MKSLRLPLVLAGLTLPLGGLGCVAKIADAAHKAAGDGGPTYDDDKTGAINSPPLRRLSKAEYVNTVHDVVTRLLPGADGESVWSAAQPKAALYPDDALIGIPNEKRGGFHRLDQNVTQAHVDATYASATTLGSLLAQTQQRRQALLGSCGVDADTSNDRACLEAFLRTKGELILRRPLTDDDVKFYADVADGPLGADTFADVLGVLFASPDFLNHVENGVDDTGVDAHLTTYELAARLSYHFWQLPPDDELLQLARAGELRQPEVYAAQVDRLFNDPRTRPVLDAFFGEWLRLEELEPLDSRVGDPVFNAFAGADLPGPTLRASVLGEVLDVAAYVTAHGQKLSELVTNRKSFARTSDLARLYGASVWDGQSEPLEMPDPLRVGLLTRVAFLATGSANTRPIMKGVRIRTAMLCDSIPPPPPAAANVHIDLSPTLTTREVVESLTQQPGTACTGCHSTVINPLGFATENFDALGRVRTDQILYDASGQVVGRKAVDTRSVPQVTSSDQRPSTGAGDLTRYMLESGRLESCFARQYFRFAFDRIEDTTQDKPALDGLTRAAREHSLADALKAVALRPEFQMRSFQ